MAAAEFGLFRAVFAVASSGQRSLCTLQLSGSCGGQWQRRYTCIYCKATNQPSGTPEFLCCTGKFIVVVFAAEAFAVCIKDRNLAGRYEILRYTGPFAVEVFDCSDASTESFWWTLLQCTPSVLLNLVMQA